MGKRRIGTSVFSAFNYGYPSRVVMVNTVYDFCLSITEPTDKDRKLMERKGVSYFVPCLRCPIHAVCETTKPSTFDELSMSDLRALYKAVKSLETSKPN